MNVLAGFKFSVKYANIPKIILRSGTIIGTTPTTYRSLLVVRTIEWDYRLDRCSRNGGLSECRSYQGDSFVMSPAGLYCTSEGRVVCTGRGRVVCTTGGRPMCTTHGRVECTTYVA